MRPEWSSGHKLAIAVIEAFETRHGVTLPVSYRDIVTQHDGADANGNLLVLLPADGGHDADESSFGFIAFRKSSDRWDMEGYMSENEVADGLVVFGTSGGGDEFAFDYRTSPIPSVVFVTRRDGHVLTRPVAEDFEGFIDAFVPNPNYDPADDETIRAILDRKEALSRRSHPPSRHSP